MLHVSSTVGWFIYETDVHSQYRISLFVGPGQKLKLTSKEILKILQFNTLRGKYSSSNVFLFFLFRANITFKISSIDNLMW